jgi:hypothetical protein
MPTVVARARTAAEIGLGGYGYGLYGHALYGVGGFVARFDARVRPLTAASPARPLAATGGARSLAVAMAARPLLVVAVAP